MGFCLNPSGPEKIRKPVHTALLTTSGGSARVSFTYSPDLPLFAGNRRDLNLLSIESCCTKSS